MQHSHCGRLSDPGLRQLPALPGDHEPVVPERRVYRQGERLPAPPDFTAAVTRLRSEAQQLLERLRRLQHAAGRDPDGAGQRAADVSDAGADVVAGEHDTWPTSPRFFGFPVAYSFDTEEGTYAYLCLPLPRSQVSPVGIKGASCDP